jgi:ubiquinone/menaquinone biosynthesis C-methylase UbiE
MSGFYERYWEDGRHELSDFSIKWPRLQGYIPRQPGITIMDFGCGSGHILTEIQRLNPQARLLGLDVSGNALRDAGTRLPEADLRPIRDGDAFPVDDASVDFIFTSEVIEHIYDTENAAAELYRVLRPGGSMLLTTPYHGFVKNLAIVLLNFDTHFDPVGPHVRFFSRTSLTSLLTRQGFEIAEYGVYGRFYPVPHSMYVLARKSAP